MDELNLTEIENKLNAEYASGQRILFWYDEEGSFEAQVDGLNLTDVTIHHLTDCNSFRTKLMIEHDRPEDKFLIYAPFARPKVDRNHLEDTLRYSREFFADRLSLIAADIGLPDRFHGALKGIAPFFGLGAKITKEATKRTNAFIEAVKSKKLSFKNIELFGIGNVVVTSEAPYKLAAKLPEYFDKILIDAPCSGEGMFRKDAAVMGAWTEKSNDTFSALQREILDYAVQMLKPGGMLMYSTCTFSPRENEESVSFLLDNHPEFSLVDIVPYEGFKSGMSDKGNCSPDLTKCIRIWQLALHLECCSTFECLS